MKAKLCTIIAAVLMVCGTARAQDMIFTLDYHWGWTTGDLGEFITEPAYRGGGLTFAKFVEDQNIALGLMVDWQGFYEKTPRETYEFDDGAITAVTFRYFYATPIMFTFDYYFLRDEQFLPFVGLNVGTVYMEQELSYTLGSFINTGWYFGVTPEAGFHYGFGESGIGLNVTGKYNWTTYSYDRMNMEDGSYWTLGLGISFLMDQY